MQPVQPGWKKQNSDTAIFTESGVIKKRCGYRSKFSTAAYGYDLYLNGRVTKIESDARSRLLGDLTDPGGVGGFCSVLGEDFAI
jgi:hypothetical protein